MVRTSYERAVGRQVSSSWPFCGLGAYLITSIFYVFPSGEPQPADYLLVLVVATTVLGTWHRLPEDPMLHLVAWLFAGWIVLVNATWFLITGDFVFLKKTSFYLYNIVVLVFVITAGYHDLAKLKKVVWWSCVLALVAQLGWLELFPAAARRATGTFNNPNQLGYWALLLMACLAVVKDREKLGPADLLALAAGFYVTALSLSKAASISAMVLLLFAGIACGLRRSAGVLLGIALILLLSFEIATGSAIDRIASLDPVAALVQRLQNIGEQRDDSLLERGYLRLIENAEYLAFGAGEGSFDRLNEEGSNKEFHSTLGNLLMSYGVPGVALFAALLVVVFATTPKRVVYLIPIMLYGLTHMGLRDSLFWVFLGLVYAQGRYDRHLAADPARDSRANLFTTRASDPPEGIASRLLADRPQREPQPSRQITRNE